MFVKSFFTAAALGLLLTAATSAQANLLSNGSFETPDASGGDVNNGGGAPWAGFNDPNTRFTSQDIARTGVQSLKTFGPFDFIGGGTGTFQTVPAVAGQLYSGKVYAQQLSSDALAGGNFGVFKLEFRDAGGNLAAGGLAGVDVFESVPFNSSSLQDAWVELGTGGIAPAGAVTVSAVIVQVQLGDESGFTGGAIYWDDAEVTVVPEPASLGLLGAGSVLMLRRRRTV